MRSLNNNFNKKCSYHDYYINQAGTGIGAVYRGANYQKGHGLGSFLKGLFRTIFPLMKSGVKSISKEAIHGSANFLNDIIDNKPAKDSFKERFSESTKNLQRKAENKIERMVGSGKRIKRKRNENKIQKAINICKKKKTAKKVKLSDIFV